MYVNINERVVVPLNLFFFTQLIMFIYTFLKNRRKKNVDYVNGCRSACVSILSLLFKICFSDMMRKSRTLNFRTEL